MRSAVLAAIKSSSIQGLKLSSELPFEESGTAVYLKNPKTVYVDETVEDTQPLLSTLDGLTISSSTVSTKVYFTTDAKNIQPTYNTNITALKGLKDTIDFAGAYTRDVQISTDYVGDLFVTEVEYRMTKLA